jgi:transposase
MKCVVLLNETEKLTLEQLSLNHRHRDIRNRAAGVLLLGSGLSASRVAARLGVSVPSPYNWAKAWSKSGVVGLLTGHGGGRPRALPDAMVAAAVQIATAEPLTLARIAQRLEAQFSKPLACRLGTLGMALKREGLSFKRDRYALKKSVTRRSLP